MLLTFIGDTNSLTQKLEQEEYYVNHYLKKMINCSESMVYNRIYLNMKEIQIYKLIQYYNYIYNIIQVKFLQITLDLNNNETLIINQILLFNKSFPDFNFDEKQNETSLHNETIDKALSEEAEESITKTVNKFYYDYNIIYLRHSEKH